jgi:hypothetical protein
VRYEFPGSTADFDANWLVIRVDVEIDGRSWRSTDPSLLTTEVASLLGWLEAPASSHVVNPELEFIEPNLSFEAVHSSPHEIRIRVWFELESRPRWAPRDAVDDRDFCVDLTLRSSEVERAAVELGKQLERFPPR